MMDRPDVRRPRTSRAGVVTAAALTLAFGMITLLFWWSGLGMNTLIDRLSRSAVWLLPAIALMAITQASLSALKWRLVLSAYGTDPDHIPSYGFCLFYSATSVLVSQFLPVHIATIAVRSFAAKRFSKISIGRGAASSLFEQCFDVLVLLVFGIATLLTWLVQGNLGIWLGLVFLGLISGYLVLLVLGRLRRIQLDTSGLFVPLQKALSLLDSHFSVSLFTPRLTAQLLGLSLLRYLTLIGRTPLIVIGMGFALPVAEMAQGFTLVQMTQFAAITPGNLGLQEWTWTGILALRGVTVLLATEFALSLRVFGILANNIGLGLIIAYLWWGRQK